jgi:hypothetical protein
MPAGPVLALVMALISVTVATSVGGISAMGFF